MIISIHAPLAGCDENRGVLCRSYGDFNPRTPCGVRHQPGRVLYGAVPFQSTHPLRGATAIGRNGRANNADFNPRTPCGVRHGIEDFCPPYVSFQSTHPLRGATLPARAVILALSISIHAPLAGCDGDCTGCINNVLHFNPRTPCGVRPRGRLCRIPRADFNPRTPCGVRLNVCLLCAAAYLFQSTHPLRGATLPLCLDELQVIKEFQSTHPLRGATTMCCARTAGAKYFNPRTPCGVRPCTSLRNVSCIIFQSTHPLRGATPFCVPPVWIY